MSKRNLALLGATFVSLIYGLTFTIAKDVMPEFVKPFGFILLRVFGAMVLFWVISFFVKTEKIDQQDFPRIIAASFFGVALNMLTFFKGLSYTSPIMGAVLMVTTPMLVLILSSIVIREKLKLKKIIGILLGLFGTAILIFNGKQEDSNNYYYYAVLVIIASLCYAINVNLIKKYLSDVSR